MVVSDESIFVTIINLIQKKVMVLPLVTMVTCRETPGVITAARKGFTGSSPFIDYQQLPAGSSRKLQEAPGPPS